MNGVGIYNYGVSLFDIKAAFTKAIYGLPLHQLINVK